MSTTEVALRLTATGGAVVSGTIQGISDKVESLKDSAGQAGAAAGRMGDQLRNLAGALGVAFTVKQFIDAADSMSLMAARLKIATDGADDYARAQGDVYRIAQANNLGLQEATALYTKLAGPIKALGGGTREVGAIIDAFATSLRVGGASTQEAAAATLQFAQAMGSGKLQGDELHSLAEASPRFMKALADGLGVPIGALKDMGTAGELTADVVGNALIRSLEKLKIEADALPDTVGGAMTRLKNDTLLAIDDINKSSGLTLGLAELVELVRRELVPAIKTELSDAFMTVSNFLTDHKEKIGEIWGVAKSLVGDIWSLAQAAGRVLGFLVDWALETDQIKTRLEVVRLLMAGLRDGINIIGAAFAHVGSQILQLLVSPLTLAGDAAAAIVGVWDGDLAAKISSTVSSIKAFAQAGQSYADEVVTKFASGESAVQALGREMQKSASDGNQLRVALAGGAVSAADSAREQRNLSEKAKESAGGFKVLKSAVTDTADSLKKAAKEEAEQQKSLNDLFGISADYTKNLALLNKAYQNGSITQETYLRLLNEQINKQPFMKAAHDAESKSAKQLAKDEEELWKWRIKEADEAQKRADSINDQVNKQLAENESLRYTKEELARLAAQRLDDEIRIAAANVTRDESLQSCTREAEAHKATLQALLNLKSARDEGVILAAANEASVAWKKTADEVGQGLTDSLFRAFESGKGFFDTLWSGIKNLFKTTVMKLVMQPVQAGMTSAIGSALGMGGTAANAAGSAGSMGSLLSGGSALLGSLGTFGTAAGYGASALFGGTGLTALSGGASMIGAGSIAGGLGMVAGVLGPIALGLFAVTALLKDKSASLGYGSAAVGKGGSIDAGSRMFAFGRGNDQGEQSQLSGVANAVLTSVAATAARFGGSAAGLSLQAATDIDRKGKGSGILGFLRGGNLVSAVQTGGTNAVGPNATVATKLGNANDLGDWFANSASAAIIAGLQQSDLAPRFKDYFGSVAAYSLTQEQANNMLAFASSVQAMNESLAPLGGVFGRLGSLGIEATASMVALTGGLDQFMAKASQYVVDFYSADEQSAISAAGIRRTLSAAGIDAGSLNSKAAFRALVDSTDLNTEAGRSQLAALLNVSADFAKLGDYLQAQGLTLEQAASTAPQVALLEQAQSQSDLATQTVDNTKATADGVTALRESIASLREDTRTGLASVALYNSKMAKLFDSWDSGGRMMVSLT